jgi:hypothetical protein
VKLCNRRLNTLLRYVGVIQVPGTVLVPDSLPLYTVPEVLRADDLRRPYSKNLSTELDNRRKEKKLHMIV